MRAIPFWAAAATALVFLSGCARDAPSSDIRVGLDELAGGFDAPVYATHDGTGSRRIYVVEQGGRILRVEPDGTARSVFLDIRGLVGSGGERGLLGLAFHEFEASGRFFVHYTDKNGDTVLASYEANEARTEALPASAKVLLRQEQPFPNHNGGMIAIGPDGFLYVGLGDGGSGGDPQGNAQRLTTLLGKLLRLDVSAQDAACPPTNPVLGKDARCEIWAYGLRNPWRFSFDQKTGDLFIGDVGQNRWEEIDYAPASSRGGENYGWNAFEGSHRFRAGEMANHVPPIAEYPTGLDGTCSVTGGYVYRGKALAALEGVYVFGDYCSGQTWTLERKDSRWERFELLATGLRISSFGEDAEGELLVVDHGGSVHRLVKA